MWRKVLPVYKKAFYSLRSISLISGLFLLLTGAPAVAGESGNSLTMPTIEGIETLDMPTITSSGIGSGFYKPGVQNTKKSGAPSDSSAKKSDNKNDSSAVYDEKSNNKTKQLAMNDLITSLTASDISSLGNMGLLSSLYSLNEDSAYSNSNDSLQLSVILKEIEALRDEVNDKKNSVSTEISNKVSVNNEIPAKQNEIVDNVNNNSSTTAKNTTPKKYSSLLRFTVNGYDIRNTCKVVYISKIQPDGSFLLTGDRNYESDGRHISETFYILFKMSDIQNGQKIYSIDTELSQNIVNEYSFIYQLSQKDDLKASQTGNLVVLHTSDPTWKLDLLLDINEE